MKQHSMVAALLCLGIALATAGCTPGGVGGGSSEQGSSASSGASQRGVKVAILLPSTQTSARYTTHDAPYFNQFFAAHGWKNGTDFLIENAQGDPTTMRTQADQAITRGAKVLVIDSIDSGSGAAIEASAKARGVTIIDYDRLTFRGHAAYFVSFDDVEVGRLQGEGLVNCIRDWHVASPHVLEIQGAPTDSNTRLFIQGAASVLDPLYKNGTYIKVGQQEIPRFDPVNAQTYYVQQKQAHPEINAVLTVNDDFANAVITAEKAARIQPRVMPTTGQDATLAGLQNILDGYQCMTVYKPIRAEVQATGNLVLALLKGDTASPPGISGTSNNGTREVPSLLINPIAVTAANMRDTVVKDGFVDTADLCKGHAAECKAAGIP